MLTHYTNAMRNYAIFRGRASRAEFWWFYTVYMIAAVAVILLDQAYFGELRENSAVVVMLFGAVHILPGMPVQVRRLHDIDASGWWILVNLTGIGVLEMLIVAMLRGTPGPNRFGSEPGEFEEDIYSRQRPTSGSTHRQIEPEFGSSRSGLAAPNPRYRDDRYRDDRYRDGDHAPAEPSFASHADSPARPHSAPPASVRGPADLIGDLERLAALRQNGGLTDAEFEVMRAKALSRGFDRS